MALPYQTILDSPVLTRGIGSEPLRGSLSRMGLELRDVLHISLFLQPVSEVLKLSA